MTVPGTAEVLLSLLEENNIHCHTYIEDVERSEISPVSSLH